MSRPEAAGALAVRARALVGPALLRFVAVGTVNTAVDVAIYTGLVWVHVPMVAANLVSTSCGLAVSFVLNRNFVFRVTAHQTTRQRAGQIGLFLLTTGFGLWVLQPLVILGCTALLRGSALHGLALVLLPKLLATCVTLVWNYLLYSLVVFAGHQRGPATAAPPVSSPERATS